MRIDIYTARLNSPGVAPTIDLNDLEKLDASLKPRISAISSTVAPSRRSRFASSTIMWCLSALKVSPSSFSLRWRLLGDIQSSFATALMFNMLVGECLSKSVTMVFTSFEVSDASVSKHCVSASVTKLLSILSMGRLDHASGTRSSSCTSLKDTDSASCHC